MLWRSFSHLLPATRAAKGADDDDDDADDELYRYLPQQGAAEATDALHRVTPEEVYFGHFMALTWYRFTAIFGFVGTIAV